MVVRNGPQPQTQGAPPLETASRASGVFSRHFFSLRKKESSARQRTRHCPCGASNGPAKGCNTSLDCPNAQRVADGVTDTKVWLSVASKRRTVAFRWKQTLRLATSSGRGHSVTRVFDLLCCLLARLVFHLLLQELFDRYRHQVGFLHSRDFRSSCPSLRAIIAFFSPP